MTRQILTLIFCSWTLVLFAQSDKLSCYDIDCFVNKTIDVINKHDTDAYITILVDPDTAFSMMKKADPNDTVKLSNFIELYKLVDDRITAENKRHFSELIEKIGNKLKTNDWVIKLNRYIILDKYVQAVYTSYSLKIKIKVNDKKCKLLMKVVKYNDRYYIFDHIRPSDFSIDGDR